MGSNELLEEYNHYLLGKRNLASSSARVYLNQIYRFAADGRDLMRVTETDIVLWLEALRTKSRNTRKLAQTAIRVFYGWLVQADYLDRSPAQYLRPLQEEVNQPNMPTPDEVARMIAACPFDERGRRNAAIIACLADTGIRRSELTRLNVGDVNLQEEHFTLVIKANKTKRGRIVPFGLLRNGSLVAETFAAYWEERTIVQKASPNEPFWISRDRDRLAPRTVNNVLSKVLNDSGITKSITVHSFRHYYATYQVMNGATIQKVRALLGHAWITTTETYIQIAEQIKGDTLLTSPNRELKADKEKRGFVRVLKR